MAISVHSGEGISDTMLHTAEITEGRRVALERCARTIIGYVERTPEPAPDDSIPACSTFVIKPETTASAQNCQPTCIVTAEEIENGDATIFDPQRAFEWGNGQAQLLQTPDIETTLPEVVIHSPNQTRLI